MLSKGQASLLLAALMLAGAPVLAGGAGDPDERKHSLTIYGWLPDIRGTLNQEIPGSGNTLRVDAETLLDNLDMTAQISYEVRRGDWSFVADVVYLDEGAEESGAVTVPEVPGLVLDTEARLDLTAWIAGAGGARRFVDRERGDLSLLLGVRYFRMDTDLALQFDGPIPPELSTATSSSQEDLWDAIVGIRGRIRMGERWFVPYHVDIGAGESEFTWQALAGFGYGFRWGSVFAVYRGLGYNQGSGEPVDNFRFAGPALAVNFRF